jgi:hypothetical protein
LVVFQAGDSHQGIPEDLPEPAAHEARDRQRAPALDPGEHLYEIGTLDLMDRLP